LANEGMTMLIVTHEMRFARDVSTRIFFMNEGIIYEDGTPEQIYEHPVHSATKAFVNRIQKLVYEIDSDNYDFLQIHTDINRFCIKYNITGKQDLAYWLLKEMLFTDSEVEKCTVTKGDLLVCEGGDVGRSAIWTEDREIYYQNALHRIRFKSQGICPEFFLYVLRNYKERGIIDDVCKGVTIKHFTGQVFRSIDFPFPPASEQRRIVKTVKAYYKILDEIVAGLD